MWQLIVKNLLFLVIVLFSIFTDRAFAAQTHNNSIGIIHADSRSSYDAPVEHFTGKAHITPLFSANKSANFSGGYIAFKPSARTAWHIHPTGQRLIITDGIGWVQMWKGPIIEIRSGDIVGFLRG